VNELARERLCAGVPGAQQTAEQDELAQVIRVVVDQQDGFAGERLIVGVLDGRQDIQFFECRD